MKENVLKVINSPIATMVTVLGVMNLSKYIDMTSAKNIMILRIAYISSQMIMLAFWTWLRAKALKEGKKGNVEYEEPAKPFSGEPPKKVKVTIGEYDAMEVGKQLQQIITGSLIMLVIHGWFGVVQPLFLQILLPWKNLLSSPVVQIYLLGMPAEGALARPFKQPNPLADLMGGDSTAPAVEENAITGEEENASFVKEIPDDESFEKIEAKPTVKAVSRKKAARRED